MNNSKILKNVFDSDKNLIRSKSVNNILPPGNNQPNKTANHKQGENKSLSRNKSLKNMSVPGKLTLNKNNTLEKLNRPAGTMRKLNLNSNSNLNPINPSVNINPNLSLKRKFSSYNNQESIIEKSKMSTIKLKIDELFRRFCNQAQNQENKQVKNNSSNSFFDPFKSWKEIFQDFFEKEKIIDFSSPDFIPKSLNSVGSYVMKLEKFWLLWIEITKKELTLETLVNLTNEGLSYLNNDKLIKQTFNSAINFLKINKKEIQEFCKNKKIKINNFNFQQAGKFDYLLEKNSLKGDKESQGKSEKLKKLSPYFGGREIKNYENSEKIFEKSSNPIKQEDSTIANPINNINMNFSNNSINNLNFYNPTQTDSVNSNKTFSIYDLITGSSVTVDGQDQDPKNNLQSEENKYEASIMTIHEANNEETITYQNRTMLNEVNGEGLENDKSYENFDESINQTNFVLKSPENLGNNVDTKLIIKDIENITTTLKKEIEQLKSPEVDPNLSSNDKRGEELMEKFHLIQNNKNGNLIQESGNLINSDSHKSNASNPCTPIVEYEYASVISENNKNIDSPCNPELKINNNSNSNSTLRSPEEEDSYERYLKEAAEKKGLDTSEFISYTKFKPKLSSDNLRVRELMQEEDSVDQETIIPDKPQIKIRVSTPFSRKSRKNKFKSKSKSKSKSKTRKSKSQKKNKKEKK